MNRRHFLTRAAISVAALTVDPERLLWTPGQRTIFVPPLPKLTLAEFAAFYRPDPRLTEIVERMMQTNDLLHDIAWLELEY